MTEPRCRECHSPGASLDCRALMFCSHRCADVFFNSWALKALIASVIRALLARVRADEREARTDAFERASRRSIGAEPPAPAINFRSRS